MVFHEDSNLVYLACSNPESRTRWLPTVGHLNKTGASHDYIAIWNPETQVSKKLILFKFDSYNHIWGLSVLGLDVVSSTVTDKHIWLYAINNRPLKPKEAAVLVKPDPVVEIFRGDLGSDRVKWMGTVKDPLIGIPNDIIGSGDGFSFYITNNVFKGTLVRVLVHFILLRLYIGAATKLRGRPWFRELDSHILSYKERLQDCSDQPQRRKWHY